jgi:hypothetical protein
VHPIRTPGGFAAYGAYHSLERRAGAPRRVFLLPEDRHIIRESKHPQGGIRIEGPSGGARQELGRLAEIGQGKERGRDHELWSS